MLIEKDELERLIFDSQLEFLPAIIMEAIRKDADGEVMQHLCDIILKNENNMKIPIIISSIPEDIFIKPKISEKIKYIFNRTRNLDLIKAILLKLSRFPGHPFDLIQSLFNRLDDNEINKIWSVIVISIINMINSGIVNDDVLDTIKGIRTRNRDIIELIGRGIEIYLKGEKTPRLRVHEKVHSSDKIKTYFLPLSKEKIEEYLQEKANNYDILIYIGYDETKLFFEKNLIGKPKLETKQLNCLIEMMKKGFIITNKTAISRLRNETLKKGIKIPIPNGSKTNGGYIYKLDKSVSSILIESTND